MVRKVARLWISTANGLAACCVPNVGARAILTSFLVEREPPGEHLAETLAGLAGVAPLIGGTHG